MFLSLRTRGKSSLSLLKKDRNWKWSCKCQPNIPLSIISRSFLNNRPISVECKRGVKISEMRVNKWKLMMRKLLTNHNFAIKDALVMLKKNIDKEFEGIEECPICYYVIHSATGALPKFACKNCKYLFHAACMQKWFSSSNKSVCPMCK